MRIPQRWRVQPPNTPCLSGQPVLKKKHTKLPGQPISLLYELRISLKNNIFVNIQPFIINTLNMKKFILPCVLSFSLGLSLTGAGNAISLVCPPQPQNGLLLPAARSTYYLSDMNLSKGTCGDNRTLKKNLSSDGNALTLKGVTYTNGVGAHAPSRIIVKTNGAASFQTLLGIDDEAKVAADHGVADYAVTGVKTDQTQHILQSGTIRRSDASPVEMSLDISGFDFLILDLTNGIGSNWADHADWVETRFETDGEAPFTVTQAEMESGRILPVVDPPTHPSTPGLEAIALLGDMDVTKSTTGWAGHPTQANLSIEGNALTLKDTVYTSGVGTHATSEIIVKLNGAGRFVSRVGIDDEVKQENRPLTNRAICTYAVIGKGGQPETTLAAGVIKATDKTSKLVDVNCDGFKYLILRFDSEGGSGNDSDHANWCNAYFEHSGNNDIPPYMVSADEISSKLDCATRVFSQPGVRFMHKLRAANPEARLSVNNLPEGLTFNERRQLVEGTVAQEGTYNYTVLIEADGEQNEETVTLTVSTDLAQPTPFMGWISWNVFQSEVSEDNVIGVANAFVDLGLDKYGYRYICLDDLWHASSRAADGKPQYDPNKFPNGLKYLTDSLHRMNMRLGIYSDAASHTCAGAYGSLGYEATDARQYAEWGFDLLKYDACGTDGLNAQALAQRYKVMGDALKGSGRDILFYLCEWGSRDPWLWGAESGGTCWRVTYDSRDIWDHGQHDGGHCGAIQGIDIMKRLGYYAGVNRFNDADMMMTGLWGTGKSSSNAGARGMTATEYQSQFSMWCMFASPLTICNDVRFWSNPSHLAASGLTAAQKKKLADNKENDLNMLTNEEMIAVNQDRMGQAALLMKTEQNNNIEIYMKDLENGDIALAVLNRGTTARQVALTLADYYLEEGQTYVVRDLWEHAYTDTTDVAFNTRVKSHETKVFRLTRYEGNTDDIASRPAAGTAIVPQVSTRPGTVTLTCKGSQGLSKRILISDLSGHILATGCSKEETVSLPFQAPKGIYIANCICGGQSADLKFTY